MKNIYLLLILISPALYSQQEPAKTLVFRNVTILPMDKNVQLSGQDVVIENGRILETGATGKLKYSKDAIIVDGTGKFLMPGLAEMHAHIPPVEDINPMKENLLLFLTHGITTIRGMLGHPKHLELREMIASGQVPGPRFFTSGPSLNGNSVSSPAKGAEMVRQQKRAGYDFLKLHPGLSKEKFDSIAVAAKSVNIPFAGHVSYGVGVWHAARSGYSTIDHLDGFIEGIVPGIEQIAEKDAGLFGIFVADKADTGRIDSLMTVLKKNFIWVVPTQALTERWLSSEISTAELLAAPEMKYMSAEQSRSWAQAKDNFMNQPAYNAEAVKRYNTLRRKLILACQRTGVGLLLGSDAPQVFNVPGPSTHHELVYMVNSGLSPYEALRSGTYNIGVFYGDEKLGVIGKGAYADLILLDRNPLENIRNTQTIRGVMANGRWIAQAEIRQILKGLEKQ